MAEDWLPHEPPPQPAPKNPARKTMTIWVVLLALFCGIYWLASGPDAPRKQIVETGYSGWWIWFAAGVGLLPVIFIGWHLRGSRQFQSVIRPSQDALAEGNYPRAVELLREVLGRYRRKPSMRAVVQYHLGYALTRAGDSAAAVGELLQVERSPKLGIANLGRLLRVELARAFAIGGDLDRSARWLDAARTSPSEIKGDARLAAMEGLLLCRQGKLAEALRHYEQVWRHLEAQLTVDEMCEPWLLRAYATASTSSVRDAGTADTWMQLVRSSPGGLLWLTAHWPELQTFVTTNSLAA